MKLTHVKVVWKMTSELFGCDPDYFKKFIKGKALKIVHSTHNHYVRVEDENQEEWGLFAGQYTLIAGPTGLENVQKAKGQKAKLPEKQT